MKNWHEMNARNIEPKWQFLHVIEIDAVVLANLTTKRKIAYIGVSTFSRDPIFREYEELMISCPNQSIKESVAESKLIIEDKYSLNLMRKMYFSLGNEQYRDVLKFVKSTEGNVLEL